MTPQKVQVNRSQLRQKQRNILRKAKGRTVVVVSDARAGGEVKYVLDSLYFEQLWKSLAAAVETLEITTDRRLFNQILRAGETLDEDMRGGKLRRLEEAFGAD
jgi:hypothetical protein